LSMARKPKIILPKHLSDIESVELIHGPPAMLLTYDHFRPYQRWMASTMLAQDCFMAAEMGLGKTGASLWAMFEGIRQGLFKRPLVVAPLRVAEYTWPEEIATWDFAREMTFRIVTGTVEERIAALAYSPARVTIINRENLRWLHEFFEGKGWPFDCLVYDEASRLKKGMKRVNQSKEQRMKGNKAGLTELGVLHAHKRSWNRIIELSGTPSPNGLIDLWGPISVIDDGHRLGTSMSAFESRWFNTSRYSYGVTARPHAEAEIMKNIDDIFFSLRESDYLDLPPMIEVDHVVHLPDAAMKKYREFEREMAVDVVNNQGDTEVIEAVNNGVLTGKLLQIANGSMYLGDKFDEETGGKMPKESVKLHSEKLDALDSIMEEAGGRPVLVAYSFQFDKAAIKKRFPYVRIFGESQSDVRDWNAGKIKMLLTHPASAGHGLNFQHGSNIAVWFGLTWSLELYRQFIKRLHRSGQKADRVFLHRIVAAGTVDENVMEAMLSKGATQDQITEAVRIRLDNTLRIAA
jgi:SNF2 family DNA or RNA helicase